MVAALKQLLHTEEEYLAMERETDERNEYIDGYIFRMAGESQEHGEIVVNLGWILGSQLRGTPCRGRSGNSKIRTGPRPQFARSQKGMYSYPDFFVVCGELEFHDEFQDVITNPTVIFEVLSPSTESYDRGEKFFRYQNWSPTLKDYILISQTSPTVEHFSRLSDRSWNYRVYQGLDVRFTIKSIKCKLTLAEIFDRVKFPTDEPEKKRGTKKAAKKKTTATVKEKKKR
ncbi:MAG: Uma2 family endonuclease [Acidobacteriota bacterium]|nr:Uma2 family endonuclease [Acidobacteriota bacterium]